MRTKVIFALAFVISSLAMQADDSDGAPFPYSRFGDDLALLSYLKNKNQDFILEYSFLDRDKGISFYILGDGAESKVLISRLGEVAVNVKIDGRPVEKGRIFTPVEMLLSGQVKTADGVTKDTQSGSVRFTVGRRISKPDRGTMKICISREGDPGRVIEVIWDSKGHFVVNEAVK